MGLLYVMLLLFCNVGGGLWLIVDDYLWFVWMLLGDGMVDGVWVLLFELVCLMCIDWLIDE